MSSNWWKAARRWKRRRSRVFRPRISSLRSPSRRRRPARPRSSATRWEKAGTAAKAAVAAYTAKHGIEGGYCGWANAATSDVGSPIVQYLLREGGASGAYDGRVIIEFPQEYSASQSLDYNEAGATAAAAVLSGELGVDVYCDSHAD